MASPLFLCTLAGVAMTLFAWYGPWAWPGFPAFGAIRIAFGSHEGLAELPSGRRAAWMVALIALNTLTWAALLRGVWWALARGRTSLEDRA